MEKDARKIGHLDMDAFYAAVEQLDNPAYRGKPVIVGGLGPRGVVSTASYEAREFGVKSAMPMAKARKLCPHAIFLPPRFPRYKEISDHVRAIIRDYTPIIEPISLDEAFFDLTDSERVVHLADGYEVKALVADDNRENREVLSQLLSDIGVSVITAEDGREAVQAAREHKPDIIFMDIRMPVMDGIEAARRILKFPDSPPPKIVAVSASALIHEQRRYLEAGFDDFIAKPLRAERVFRDYI